MSDSDHASEDLHGRPVPSVVLTVLTVAFSFFRWPGAGTLSPAW